MDAFVARQPIFNRNQVVIGYELLYRDSEQNFFNTSVTSNIATAILLMNSYFHFGINNLVDNTTAFINFDDNLIKSDIPQLLSSSSVVIEILESIVPDEQFIEKLIRLRNDGYTIAIDDYTIRYAHKEIINLSQILKVDFLLNSREELQEICLEYRRRGKILLAEKVETKEDYEFAKKLGFEYFQGYFFAKPSIVKSKNLSVSAAQYIHLLNALYKPVPDFREIAKIIEIDVNLTYKLLRVVNSSFSLATQITSIHQALSILGINAFSKWLCLATIQNLGKTCSTEIVKVAMIRSKLLELIGLNSSLLVGHEDELALLGILSVIDVLLNEPIERAVENLPLTPEVKDTFMRKDTIYLNPYKLCLDYERGNFKHIEAYCEMLQYDINLLPEHYYEAIKWSEELLKYMEDIDATEMPE